MSARQSNAWWGVAIASFTASFGGAQQRPLAGSAPIVVPAVQPSDSTQRIVAVSAVALGQQGEVVLADNKRHELRWFDAHGAEIAKRPLKTRSGRPVFAASIAITESGEVLVLDRIEYTAHIFGRGTQSATSRTVVAPGFEALTMCYADGVMVLAGVNNDHLLHVYASGGKRVKSFAPPLGSIAAQRAISMAGTLLACTTGKDLYATANKAFPLVRTFHRDGTLAWSYEIPKFRGLDIRTTPDGAVTFRKARGAADGIRTLTVLTDGRVVVQIARGGSSLIETHVLAANNGDVLEVNTNTPEIAASGGNRIGIVSNKDAMPHVKVLSVTAQPRR